ncbi:hypothetical protein [Ruminiclostridium josui]|uniref:hypothetical protein n=1 Tax=Ruminiclostridium josui TaxID=1499 RepID=UPI0006D23803|nr:hypothetical protein [Ruminiclostridium josui]
MQFGKLTNEQLLNPKIRTCYNDIIRKTRYIAYKVDIINDIRKDLLAKMPDISETDQELSFVVKSQTVSKKCILVWSMHP